MLQFDPGLEIWTLITFVVLLAVLAKTAWPRILAALDARETKIRSALGDAEAAKKEAERVREEYDRIVSRTKKDAADIINRGKEQAEKVREELIAQAKSDAEILLEKTKNELELEREKAVSELKTRAVDLSVAIAARIITSSLTPEKQKELARQALKEMESRL